MTVSFEIVFTDEEVAHSWVATAREAGLLDSRKYKVRTRRHETKGGGVKLTLVDEDGNALILQGRQ